MRAGGGRRGPAAEQGVQMTRPIWRRVVLVAALAAKTVWTCDGFRVVFVDGTVADLE